MAEDKDRNSTSEAKFLSSAARNLKSFINVNSDRGGSAVLRGASYGGQALRAGVTSPSVWSIILICGGIFVYILRLLDISSSFIFILSLALFFISGFALSEKLEKDRTTILLPMMAFLIWYYFFNSSYNPTFLIFFCAVFLIISLIIVVFTKGDSMKAEFVGFIPALFLFLDLGLIPFLVEKIGLPITPLLTNLILFMPWWALLGLFTLPTEMSRNGSVNFIAGFLRVVGIFYILFVLIAPALPNVGYDLSLLPSVSDLEEAQAQLREKMPQTENIAYSNLVCVFNEWNNVQTCVQNRQEKSKIDYICIKVRGYDPSDLNSKSLYNLCVEEQKKLIQNQVPVNGMIDPTIKIPTTASFSKDSYFPKLSYRNDGEDLKTKFPINFKFVNPRLQSVQAEFSCYFKQGEEIFPGLLKTGSAGQSVLLTESTEEKTMICEPVNKQLKGNYKLVYEAKLYDLKTVSKLQRAFIGDKTATEKESLIPKIKRLHFSSGNYLSQAPADLARINFAFGNPLENPIIEGSGEGLLSSNVQSAITGRYGNILAIKSYHLGLDGFNVDDFSCLDGNNLEIPETGGLYNTMIYLPTCVITNYPTELQAPEDYIFKEFEAELIYDYLIKDETDITVQVLSQKTS